MLRFEDHTRPVETPTHRNVCFVALGRGGMTAAWPHICSIPTPSGLGAQVGVGDFSGAGGALRNVIHGVLPPWPRSAARPMERLTVLGAENRVK